MLFCIICFVQLSFFPFSYSVAAISVKVIPVFEKKQFIVRVFMFTIFNIRGVQHRIKILAISGLTKKNQSKNKIYSFHYTI